MENGGPWYRSNESVCTESEWFTSTQGSVRRSGDVTGTALLCLSFPELIYSRLTVNGGQYGAGASINGGRPRGADDAICSAYYQGRADTAPSVPSAPSARLHSRRSASFSKHSTTLAAAVVTIIFDSYWLTSLIYAVPGLYPLPAATLLRRLVE